MPILLNMLITHTGKKYLYLFILSLSLWFTCRPQIKPSSFYFFLFLLIKSQVFSSFHEWYTLLCVYSCQHSTVNLQKYCKFVELWYSLEKELSDSHGQLKTTSDRGNRLWREAGNVLTLGLHISTVHTVSILALYVQTGCFNGTFRWSIRKLEKDRVTLVSKRMNNFWSQIPNVTLDEVR